MLSQAKEFLSNFIKADRVKLIHEDALGFLRKQESSFFDVFASGFTLHNFERDFRERIIKEVYRVLKKEGIFLNADKYALDDEAKHNKILSWQLNKIKEEYSRIKRPDLKEEWTKHYLEDNKPEVIMKEKESIELMNKLGFKDAKIIFREQLEAVLFARK